MKQPESSLAFGEADPTDNRQPLDWQTKYCDPVARKAIRREAAYLGGLLFAAPLVLAIFWLEYPKTWIHLTDQKYHAVLKYTLAWAAGTLGGTLFDLKWLYHAVARQLWHLDRRLWRLFIPHISGGLAFAVVVLMASGLIRVFDAKSTDSHTVVVGVSFLVGYFSDSALAKLREVAQTLFGTTPSEPQTDRVGNRERSLTLKEGA
jgi:hypothetical protein